MERFGFFDSSLHYALDYEYWLRVGRKVDFHYLEGAYLAGSRLHEGTKTSKCRIPAHHEILEVVMRYGSSPPNAWLMNFASVVVETERRKRGVEKLDEETSRGLFVQAVLENADIHGVPLGLEFLNRLERMLDAV
jgi:hypothetical protein